MDDTVQHMPTKIVHMPECSAPELTKLCPHGLPFLTCKEDCPKCGHHCNEHDCWGVGDNPCSDPDCDCEWTRS